MFVPYQHFERLNDILVHFFSFFRCCMYCNTINGMDCVLNTQTGSHGEPLHYKNKMMNHQRKHPKNEKSNKRQQQHTNIEKRIQTK